jgi:hypothetical protein
MSLDLDPQVHPNSPWADVTADMAPLGSESVGALTQLAGGGRIDARQSEVLRQLRSIVALLVDGSFGVDPVRLAQPDVDEATFRRGHAGGSRP